MEIDIIHFKFFDLPFQKFQSLFICMYFKFFINIIVFKFNRISFTLHSCPVPIGVEAEIGLTQVIFIFD